MQFLMVHLNSTPRRLQSSGQSAAPLVRRSLAPGDVAQPALPGETMESIGILEDEAVEKGGFNQ